MKLLIKSINPVAAFLVLVVLNLASSNVSTQQSTNGVSEERDRGIQLYKQRAKGAIEVLREAVKRNRDDISAWHYLGLAYDQSGDSGAARKAHEKAARLGGEDLLTRELARPGVRDFGGLLNPFASQLAEAAESALKYLDLNPKASAPLTEEWRERARYLRDFAEAIDAGSGNGSGPRVLSKEEVATQARIVFKVAPEYTREARLNHVTGRVVLRVLLAADGKVKGLFPIEPLPDGLSATSIKAARQIKFVPAIKDGQSVSQVSQLEYNFQLYP